MSFYKQAALVLDHLDKNAGSVKGSLAASGVSRELSPSESKRVLALVIETLKYKPTLQTLLTTVPILTLEKLTFPKRTPPNTPSSASLVLVLAHDLLFSAKKRIEASDKWVPKEAMSRHQTRLRAELVRLQIRSGKARVEDLAKRPGATGVGGDSADAAAAGQGDGVGGEGVEPYRYVRWNPNVDLHRKGDWSLDALHRHLAKRGYTKVDQAEERIPLKGYREDEHLGQELLVFNGRTNWWVKDEWYTAGAIILQDKASCMPAKVLMHGWTGGECIDGTAAPGNKTSYISALSPHTPVTAFERDARRFKTLEKMLDTANCKNVARVQGDFTQSKPTNNEWSGVTHILLDPSCSGSGIVNRLDYLVENAPCRQMASSQPDEAETEEAEGNEAKALRLEKLAAFQLQMIQHAFKFPAATRVVYSTCSIHAEEDERVVLAALQSGVAKERGWRLAPRSEMLPAWPRRGRVEEFGGDQAMADAVIRCLPQDRTNGFFVSCFIRGPGGVIPAAEVRGANGSQGDGGAANGAAGSAAPVQAKAAAAAAQAEGEVEDGKTAAQRRKAKKNKKKNEKKKGDKKRKAGEGEEEEEDEDEGVEDGDVKGGSDEAMDGAATVRKKARQT